MQHGVQHLAEDGAHRRLEGLTQGDVHNEDADLEGQGKGVQAEDILHAQLPVSGTQKSRHPLASVAFGAAS